MSMSVDAQPPATDSHENGDRVSSGVADQNHAVEVTITPSVDLSACGDDDTVNVLVSLKPQVGTARSPCDIVCVMDVSGSMGTEATIQNASGVAESHGLSLLDIAKHGVRTVVENLTEQDRFSLVQFNQVASVVCPLTSMTEDARKHAVQQLDTMQAQGGTHIWRGLETALSELARESAAGRFAHVLLLTDGQSSEPATIVPKVKSMLPTVRSCTISTFGFGYGIESMLLCDLAEVGGGAYSFIPDAGFVGTAFVHMMSRCLVTMARDAVLELEVLDENSKIVNVYNGRNVESVGAVHSVQVGTLQYGQSIDVVLCMRVKDCGDYIAARLSYTQADAERVTLSQVTANTKATVPCREAVDVVEEQFGRCLFVLAIKQAVRVAKCLREEDVAQGTAVMEACASAIQNLSAYARSKFLQDLASDITGQAMEALSKKEYYAKWGKHYLPSLMFAHSLQMCNNFKDPGVQHYGGKLFEDLRDVADDIFNTLPAPKGSIKRGPSKQAARPVNMATYNDRYGGCVDGSCLVELIGADGDSTRRRVPLSAMSKGDKVAAFGGAVAEVICVVASSCKDGIAHLVELPDVGPRLTPYHPFFAEGLWRFPIDSVPTVKELPCTEVVSFIVRGAPALLVEGVPCVALGHGLQVGAAGHPFFASERAVEDLSRFPGFASGRIELAESNVVRDPETGMVCGFTPLV
eukprot:TRINITY_DN2757_c1_g2_i2.p1 TRINITY_DN2757_c1_g2~~TRINITY_DN2757_c1_g2_i2.p1  ORF type:complete len:693 (+),score=114.57 TRINITY_DN2757_c1_g2_i2:49-2127(+)